MKTVLKILNPWWSSPWRLKWVGRLVQVAMPSWTFARAAIILPVGALRSFATCAQNHGKLVAVGSGTTSFCLVMPKDVYTMNSASRRQRRTLQFLHDAFAAWWRSCRTMSSAMSTTGGSGMEVDVVRSVTITCRGF